MDEEKEWTPDELNDFLRENIRQSDYIVEDIIFNTKDGAMLFERNDDKIKCLIKRHIPVRATRIEKQAFASLLDGEYSDFFLT